MKQAPVSTAQVDLLFDTLNISADRHIIDFYRIQRSIAAELLILERSGLPSKSSASKAGGDATIGGGAGNFSMDKVKSHSVSASSPVASTILVEAECVQLRKFVGEHFKWLSTNVLPELGPELGPEMVPAHHDDEKHEIDEVEQAHEHEVGIRIVVQILDRCQVIQSGASSKRVAWLVILYAAAFSRSSLRKFETGAMRDYHNLFAGQFV
jgi:hypothetical protein